VEVYVVDLVQRLKDKGRELGLRRGYDIVAHNKPFRAETVSLGLRRDLSIPFPAPDAKIPITVRPLEQRDHAVLFDVSDSSLDDGERALCKARRELAEMRIGRGFVAVTEDDEPCYVQWLFGPADNADVRRFAEGPLFPVLRQGDALLEGAFTPVRHRGKGIMPAAMARIAERAAELDARFVVTFVAEDNIPSLKGCDRAGFSPYIRRWDRWVGIRRTIRFGPLGES
jgi:hypothetical protein